MYACYIQLYNIINCFSILFWQYLLSQFSSNMLLRTMHHRVWSGLSNDCASPVFPKFWTFVQDPTKPKLKFHVSCQRRAEGTQEEWTSSSSWTEWVSGEKPRRVCLERWKDTRNGSGIYYKIITFTFRRSKYILQNF